MKRIYTTLFLSLALVANAFSQDIKAVFKAMPRDLIYGLSPELNDMLLDNPSDTTKFVATSIYEKIERKAMSSDFIQLKTSKAGTTSIKLLPLINESKIVCVVQTVEGTIADSKISFYTEKWEPIDGADLLPEGRDINWFIKEDADKTSEKYVHAMATLTMQPMKYSIAADHLNLKVEFNPKGFLSIEDYKNIEPYLTHEPKVLKWDKVRFK